jgi:two-component system, LytTR family, sensor kinase
MRRYPGTGDARWSYWMPVAVFTVYWLAAVAVHAVNYARMPIFDGPWPAVASAFVDVASWLLVWLSACVLAANLPLSGPRGLINLGVVVAAAVALLVARILLLLLLLTPLGWFGPAWQAVLAAMLPPNLVVFAMFWMGAWATVQQRQSAAQERGISARQVHYQRVKLVTLMSRLEPHFIGNALHGVSSLIYEAPDAARQMLRQLRSIVAAAAVDDERVEVRLGEEMEFTREWLDVQQRRFEGRFTFRMAANQDVADVWVPRLVLQPLVENTIKHAVNASRRPVELVVYAYRRKNHLILVVQDDGPGLNAQPKAGLGITNTRERLSVLYGPDAGLELRNRLRGGVEARISLPICDTPILEPSSPPEADSGETRGLRTARGSVGSSVATPELAALAVGVLVVAMVVHNRMSMPGGLAGTAAAIVIGVVEVASMVIPAAVALHLPRRFPVDRGGRAIAAAATMLAGVTMAAYALSVVAVSALRGAPLDAPQYSMIYAAVAVYMVVLNPLAAAYVSEYATRQEEREAVVRDLEAAALRERRKQIAAGVTLPSVYEGFQRIEASLGSDPDAANHELTRLAVRLEQALAK